MHCSSSCWECVSMIHRTEGNLSKLLAPRKMSTSPPSTSILIKQGDEIVAKYESRVHSCSPSKAVTNFAESSNREALSSALSARFVLSWAWLSREGSKDKIFFDAVLARK